MACLFFINQGSGLKPIKILIVDLRLSRHAMSLEDLLVKPTSQRLSKKVKFIEHRLNNLGLPSRITLYPSLFNREELNV